MAKDEETKANQQPVKGRSQEAMLKKIARKTYGIVIIGIVVLVVFAGLNIYSNNSKNEQLQNTMYLNQYRIGSKNLTSAVQSYAVTGDKTYYNNYMKELSEDKNRDIAWNGLKANGLKDDEWAQLEHIAEMSDGLVPLEEQAMEAVADGDTEVAQDLVFSGTYADTIAEISSTTDTCINAIQERMASKQTVINIMMLVNMIIFFIVFILIVRQVSLLIKFSQKELLTPIIKVSEMLKNLAQGNFHVENDMHEDESEVGTMVAAINFMNRNFTHMITEISEVLGKMSQGDYTVSVHEQYVGEFIEIKESMLKIIDATRHTLSTIYNVASEIGGGSEQLANAATDLAQGCTEQASKVSEISETIDALAETMEEKTADAEKTVELSTDAGRVLVESNDKMIELKDAINDISRCSEEIRSIIAVIEDIADQTNLLSLNASIEAARAGEAGKGFAVVAEQVKELAERSTQAAGETTELIQSSIEAVDKGIAISDMAVANMNTVMTEAKSATDMMSAMAQTMKQQAARMKDINNSVTAVAEIVDNNSAASQETAAVSEEQTAQVQTMVHMLEQFKIE